MLLYEKNNYKKIKNKTAKSLSMFFRISDYLLSCIPGIRSRTKALQCARRSASFTVEAAFVVPLFLFAVVMLLGFFQMLLVEVQVTEGLQYASRTLAASCAEQGEETQNAVTLVKGRILFRQYMKNHDCRDELIKNGIAGISFPESDLSGEYVELRASYQVQLPISYWGIRSLPVSQCVRSRKWIGATEDADGSIGDYVYVTETGSAYHKSTECRYLDLSVRSVALASVSGLRNKSGGIYYPCSCVQSGQTEVYITDYGTQYHGSLVCSGLKRTVYRIREDAVGSRHPCPKCYGGG